MNIIFMNSKTCKTSDPHRLIGLKRICCSIKSWYLIHIENYPKIIQKQ